MATGLIVLIVIVAIALLALAVIAMSRAGAAAQRKTVTDKRTQERVRFEQIAVEAPPERLRQR